MQAQPNKVRGEDERSRAERAVILQVLSDEHEQWWSRAELQDELVCIEAAVIDGVLTGLGEAGVVNVGDGRVSASDAVKRLDELDLICV
ncbi:MAG TPA: hypothetical protein VK672_05325 [Solirubrobacteraceae bacterium]|jgi:hypothetical protein|nr:hypothetical protein [Solirubrobacteraceae bacterium]